MATVKVKHVDLPGSLSQRGLLLCLLLMVLALTTGCRQGVGHAGAVEQDVRELTVLYTNDEHGWMEGMQPGRGAAGLYRLWEEQENYRPDGAFLLLSGGDNWTGPAISTWVAGQSMVEVMNTMHYDASAVGNHEFDFGLDALAQRAREADYPYLSANTRWRDSDEVPVELGILPFVVTEVNDLKVGIIGLTTISTPRTTNPKHVAPLRFTDYEQALRTTVPRIRKEAPDLLFVIAHVCMAALEPLAEKVTDLHIDLMGGGHCNELTAQQVGATVLLGGGYHFTAYAKAHFRFDRTAGRILEAEFATNENTAGNQDPALVSMVAAWQEQFQDTLGEVLAWNEETIDFRDESFRQALIDSWLQWDSSADIAITNTGGVRSPLPAGQITLNDLVNVMPFENNIIALDLPGEAVRVALETGGRPLVAGLVQRGDNWILVASGEPLRDRQHYRVLVNSFMYDGGDNFHILREADPEGFDTGIHYRQPFVDLLSAMHTSSDDPLTLARLSGYAAP
ncbi:MAG: bifunctional UDP-sugar hydrolase/5'-nucleotidase [Gammaproteobacteria bacterium]|nr:bifunctional metallophosphatase/5'-nucleotidase [Pseudomonadales bacterium]MCP5348532.1 bifunctional metallophosphatase/5'-nucleotidase [Pseudomonadales bacterium]